MQRWIRDCKNEMQSKEEKKELIWDIVAKQLLHRCHQRRSAPFYFFKPESDCTILYYWPERWFGCREATSILASRTRHFFHERKGNRNNIATVFGNAPSGSKTPFLERTKNSIITELMRMNHRCVSRKTFRFFVFYVSEQSWGRRCSSRPPFSIFGVKKISVGTCTYSSYDR